MRAFLCPRPGRRPFVLAILAGCFLAAAAARPAQAQKSFPPIYEGAWEGALRVSEQRNVLVVCVLLQDGEEANERFYRQILMKADVQAALEGTLLLVACDPKHRMKEIEETDENGELRVREVCARLGTPTCAIHQAFSRPMFERFSVGDGENAGLRTPFFALVLPNGRKHTAFSDVVERKKILEALAAAKKVCGPALDEATFARVKALLRSGSSELAAGAAGAAWRAFAEVLALTEKGPLAEEAKKGSALADTLRAEDLARARALLEANEVAAGWAAARRWAEDWKETPHEKAAQAELKAIQKDKRWREEIAWLEHEREAELLLEEVRGYWVAGQERKAVRFGKRLLDKYGDTKAAVRMLRELAELVERIRAS